MTLDRRRPMAARIAAVALAGSIGLVACGGSSKSKSAPTTSSPAATQATAAPSKSGGSSSSTTTKPGPDPNAAEVVAPGDIPDNQVFVPYRAAGGFTVKVPEGWSRTDIAGDHVSFSDKYNAIDLRWSAQPAAPTEATATSAIEAKHSPAFHLTGASTVHRTAGPAVLVTYKRTSDPNPVTGKRVTLDVEQYEFWRNGRSAVLTLSGATGSDNVDPWKTVTNGFAWSP